MIIFENTKEEQIATFSENFPIPKVGEIVWLYQQNNNKEIWDADEFGKECKVVKIDKEYGTIFPYSKNVRSVENRCCINIQVEELN